MQFHESGISHYYSDKYKGETTVLSSRIYLDTRKDSGTVPLVLEAWKFCPSTFRHQFHIVPEDPKYLPP